MTACSHLNLPCEIRILIRLYSYSGVLINLWVFYSHCAQKIYPPSYCQIAEGEVQPRSHTEVPGPESTDPHYRDGDGPTPEYGFSSLAMGGGTHRPNGVLALIKIQGCALTSIGGFEPSTKWTIVRLTGASYCHEL